MTIVVTSEDRNGLRQRAEIESFEELFVDAPPIVGGEGSAPDPHDYLDLALGACKAITAQMYARRKAWPLEKVSATVLRDDSRERHGLYRLDITMEFQGIEDADQRARLLEIADRCPIHRIVTTSEVQINTTLDA
ncbi:putative redox protein [Modicisalibacter ilicicola DSM 19980]|uniref:Putative redox protein n=1 Tax=Modicisalibacter ilicicola DSM 19980 TaxID=1121942 RepID=A0A1M4XBE0_9GAMM|nr:OsmC family protein [Halomonas ilicicola]SHE90854.1 putative redox protein [Halomonas ilicicola DSM 19980]